MLFSLFFSEITGLRLDICCRHRALDCVFQVPIKTALFSQDSRCHAEKHQARCRRGRRRAGCGSMGLGRHPVPAGYRFTELLHMVAWTLPGCMGMVLLRQLLPARVSVLKNSAFDLMTRPRSSVGRLRNRDNLQSIETSEGSGFPSGRCGPSRHRGRQPPRPCGRNAS